MMNPTETLNQLTLSNNGISTLATFVGAKDFAKTDDSIQFKFPAMKHAPRYNFCKITLDASDTYTVRFSRIVKHQETKVLETSGLYCDMLKNHFETITGCYLSF